MGQLQPESMDAATTVRVLCLSDYYPPAFKGGGPLKSLQAIAESPPASVDIAVMTSDKDLGLKERLPVESNRWTTYNGVTVYFTSTNSLSTLYYSWRAARDWRPDIILMNSFFSPTFSIVPQMLARFGWWHDALVVIMPSGQINPGALDIKSTKKRIFLFLYHRYGMSNRSVWVASSDEERVTIRSIIGAKRIIVRENETALPLLPEAPATTAEGPLRAVFLARICRIKGLDVLLRALIASHGSVALDVFGPEEDEGYAAECKAMITHLPAAVSVRFLGAVDTEEVRTVLARYELLVLPTGGENFGHAIAEALSASCPVMCTPFTPWSKRLHTGGGVVVPSRNVEDWTVAIDAYAALLPEERDRRRIEAGKAYTNWHAEDKGPPILSRLRDGFLNNSL